MKPYYDQDGITIYHGKAEAVLPTLPPQSVDLIATDPPFFGVKDEAWDNQWATADQFIAWISSLCIEWLRVLKPSGSLYVFASPDLADRVSVEVRRHFHVLNRIRWVKEAGWHQKAEKEALRSYLSPWEEVIFAEVPCDDPRFSDADYALWGKVIDPLRLRLRAATKTHREAMLAIFTADGRYTSPESIRVNAARQLGWLPTEFELMTPAVFAAVSAVASLGMTYEQLRAEFDALRDEYERRRRPFSVTSQSRFSDIWNFPTVPPYPGKHVCEKPVAMMEHIIEASSRPGDTVLDCFNGSGTTTRAAANLGRNCIGIEQDARWCEFAANRLRQGVLFGTGGAA